MGKDNQKLKKELRLIDVYAIAAGTTLSAGFFLLPGLAAEQAGTSITWAYLIAAIPLVPAMLSIVELATAMPKAGGVYYFMDRTLGPVFGVIGGLGTWLALILKVAFALIGMGAYINLFFPDLPIEPIAVGIAIVLGLLNVFGARKSGGFQSVLVAALLTLMLIFVGGGTPSIDLELFTSGMTSDVPTLLGTAGLVYISYVGVTNVASLSEEVSNPERNLPLGVILAFITAVIIYGVGTAIMGGVIPLDILKGDMTPAATAADIIFGKWGMAFMSFAAMLAFTSVANAGTMSASRYPMAMSRDNMMPSVFKRLGRFGTPLLSIVVTVSLIVILLVSFDPTKIAKLASAFQLMLFGMLSLAVIVIRESRIESYDPGFKSPLYPWMQIFGILSSVLLVSEMGLFSMLFSCGLVVAGIAWYFYYAKDKVTRNGAIYHIFERLGQKRYEGLDRELRGILKEKGLRSGDPFDVIVARSMVIDLEREHDFEEVVEKVSRLYSKVLPLRRSEISNKLLEGTRIGATPVIKQVALPHFRVDGIKESELILARSRSGITIRCNDPINCPGEEEITIVNAMFFLVSPENNPTQHLRILARIAGRIDDVSFSREWFEAADHAELKEAIMHDDSFVTLYMDKYGKTCELIDKKLMEVDVPKGCLVAILRRGATTIVPNGQTTLRQGDRLTIIGDIKGLKLIRNMYCDPK